MVWTSTINLKYFVPKDKMKNQNKSTCKKTEDFKNSSKLNVIIPKEDKTVNYERLNRISSLMARTQRIG